LKRINVILPSEPVSGDKLMKLIEHLNKLTIATKEGDIAYYERRFREKIDIGQEYAAVYHLKNVIRLRTKKIILDHCEG